jgi:hypothetical protein
MKVVVDTNVLLRLAQSTDPGFPVVIQALKALRAQKQELVIFPQMTTEFWRVCTGQKGENGFGFTIPEADAKLDEVLGGFHLLHDPPEWFVQWRILILNPGAKGDRFTTPGSRRPCSPTVSPIC